VRRQNADKPEEHDVMITAHIALIAELFSPAPRSREVRAPARAPGRLRRLLRMIAAGRHRSQAPPAAHLGNHLRADIGLPPVHDRPGWLWPV
jgi:hypothetical protein